MKVIQNLKINWKLTDRQKDGLCYASIFVVILGLIGGAYMEFGVMPMLDFMTLYIDNLELKETILIIDSKIITEGSIGIVIVVFVATFGSIFILVEIVFWFTNLICKGLGINTEWSKQK